MEPVCTRSTCLYDAAQLEHVITRMAQQLVPLLAGHAHVAVIGILRRGAPLADRLCAALPQHGLLSEPLRLDLAIKRYADDLCGMQIKFHPNPKNREKRRALSYS